ncbi:Uncharacterised protein [Enterobacter hormaechei]|nr:Uncharacterised protein [Enterobacter hormaechei]
MGRCCEVVFSQTLNRIGSHVRTLWASCCKHDSAYDSLLYVQIDKTAHAVTPLRLRCSLMACS